MDIKNTLLKLKAAGLTQTQIADAIGCKQSTVSDLLAEKIGLARPSHKIVQGLTDLAAQYGIDTEHRDSTPDCHTSDTSIPGTPIDGAKVREAKNGNRKIPANTKGVMS